MASSSGSDQSFERIYCSEDDFIADCIVSDALCEAYTHSQDAMGPRHSKKAKQTAQEKILTNSNNGTVKQVGFYDVIGPSSVPVIGITPDTGYDGNTNLHRNTIAEDSNYNGAYVDPHQSASATGHQCLRPSVSEQILTSKSKELINDIPLKCPSSTSVFDINDTYRKDLIDYCLVNQQTDNIYQLKRDFSDIKLPSPPDNVPGEEEENTEHPGDENCSESSFMFPVHTLTTFAEEFNRRRSLIGLLEYEISDCFESLNMYDVSATSVHSDISVESPPLSAPVNSPNDGSRDIEMEPIGVIKSVQQGEVNISTLKYIKSKIINVFEEARYILRLGDELSKCANVMESCAITMQQNANNAVIEREILERHLIESEASWDRIRQGFAADVDKLAREVQQVWGIISRDDPETRKRTISAANALSGDSWVVDQKRGCRNKKPTEETLAELLLHRHWKDHRGLIHEINRQSQITQLKLLIFSQQSYIRDLEQQHKGLGDFLTEISKSAGSIEELVVETKTRFPLVFCGDSPIEFSYLHDVLNCDRVNYFPEETSDMNLGFLKAFQIGDYNKKVVSDDQAGFELNDIPYCKQQMAYGVKTQQC